MTSESKCKRIVYLMERTDKFYDGTDIYIGSTSKTLMGRLKEHQRHSKICDSKFYTRMQEVGIYNWKITLLETIPLCDKREIFILEKKYIEKLKPDLNKNFPVKENNEKDRERAKKHYLKSLEEKRYYCNTCEKSSGSLGIYS